MINIHKHSIFVTISCLQLIIYFGVSTHLAICQKEEGLSGKLHIVKTMFPLKSRALLDGALQ